MKLKDKIYKIGYLLIILNIFACNKSRRSFTLGDKINLVVSANSKKLISIDPSESLKNLKLKIYDKFGIPIEIQSLIRGNKVLSNEKKTIQEYNINNFDNIILNLMIKGGAQAVAKSTANFGAFIFPNFNEKIIKYGDIGSNGPKWRIVTSGMNIAAYCKNKKCPSYNKDYVWIYKNFGIGNFYVPKIVRKSLNCSACGCKIKDQNLLGVGFFDCNYEVDGERIKDPEKFPKDVNYVSVNFKRKTKKNKIEKYFSNIAGLWVYLIVDTSKI